MLQSRSPQLSPLHEIREDDGRASKDWWTGNRDIKANNTRPPLIERHFSPSLSCASLALETPLWHSHAHVLLMAASCLRTCLHRPTQRIRVQPLDQISRCRRLLLPGCQTERLACRAMVGTRAAVAASRFSSISLSRCFRSSRPHARLCPCTLSCGSRGCLCVGGGPAKQIRHPSARLSLLV